MFLDTKRDEEKLQQYVNKKYQITGFLHALLPCFDLVFCTTNVVYALTTIPVHIKLALKNYQWETNDPDSAVMNSDEFLVRRTISKWEFLGRSLENRRLFDKLKAFVGETILFTVEYRNLNNRFSKTISLKSIPNRLKLSTQKVVSSKKDGRFDLYGFVIFEEELTDQQEETSTRVFNIQPSDATDSRPAETREETAQHASNYHQPLDFENKVDKPFCFVGLTSFKDL